MDTNNKISIAAIVISFFSLFVSGFIGHYFAISSFKNQTRLSNIDLLINHKKELLDNLGALSVVGRQIAVKEYNMQLDNLGIIPEHLTQKYWESVYNGHNFEELYLILGELSKLDFEQILRYRDTTALEQFKTLKALRTNIYMSNAERAHMVYQICFNNKLLVEIEKIDDEFIRNKYKTNL